MLGRLLVQTQLSSLAEALVTAWVVTCEWFLVVMDVHVFLQILAECEPFVALGALVLAVRLVGGHVAPQGEARRVGFVAELLLANERFLVSHVRFFNKKDYITRDSIYFLR